MFYVRKHIKVGRVNVKRAENLGIQGDNIWITLRGIYRKRLWKSEPDKCGSGRPLRPS